MDGNTDDPEGRNGRATGGGSRYGAIYGTSGARRPRRAGAHRLGDAPSVDPVTVEGGADPSSDGPGRVGAVTDLRSRRRRVDSLPGPRGTDPMPEPRGGNAPGADPDGPAPAVGRATVADPDDPAPAVGRAWVAGPDGTRPPQVAAAPGRESAPDQESLPGSVPPAASDRVWTPRSGPEPGLDAGADARPAVGDTADGDRRPDAATGRPLRELLAYGPMAPDHAARLGAELAVAVAEWHGERGRHGQLSPDSVRVDADGRAHLVDPPRAEDSLDPAAVPYLAPEQIDGGRVGRAADVYAVGVILLEAVTGEQTYPGSSWSAASARLTAPPVVPNEVPGTLAGTVLAATQLDPDARPSAARVAERLGLRPAGPGPAPTSGSGHVGLARMAAFGLPVLVLLGLLGVALLGHHRTVPGADTGDNPAAAPAASTAPAAPPTAAAPTAAPPTAAAPTTAAPTTAATPSAAAPSGGATQPTGAPAPPSIALPSIGSPRPGGAVPDQAGKVVSDAAGKVAGAASDKAGQVTKQVQRQMVQRVTDRVTDTWHRFTDWLTGLI